MRKIILTIIFILLLTVFISLFWFRSLPEYPSSEPITSTKGQLIIKGNSWNVEIVMDEASQTLGLSNRKVLHNKTGMLFAFDKVAKRSFWMKDMLIPIDMIFFDKDLKIILIESNLQANTFPKTFGGSVLSQYVLEINALEAQNYGLQVEDQAFFLNK